MRTKRRLGIGIAVATAVALAALSVAMVVPIVEQAGAQVAPPLQLNAEPTSNTSLSFDVTVPTTPCVTETAVTVTGNGIAATPLSVTVVDPNTVTVVLPPTTANPLEFTLTCLDVQVQPVTAQTSLQFFAIPVTKTVEGDVPADATFTVNVACMASTGPVGVGSQTFAPAAVAVDPFSIDLAFSADGGTSYVFGYRASDCTITEPGNGGATTTAITPPTVNTDTPGTYPVSVVNTFVAVPTFTG
jgi:hypothetical protein